MDSLTLILHQILKGPIKLGQTLRTGVEYHKMHIPDVNNQVYTKIGIPAAIGLFSTLLLLMLWESWAFVLWASAMALGVIGYFDVTVDEQIIKIQQARGGIRESSVGQPTKQIVAVSLFASGLIAVVVGIYPYLTGTSPVPSAVQAGPKTPPPSPPSQPVAQVYTPAEGTPERRTITDIMRQSFNETARVEADHNPAMGEQATSVQVNYLKVHDGWCWTQVTPLGANGEPETQIYGQNRVPRTYAALLHYQHYQQDNTWTIIFASDTLYQDYGASSELVANERQQYPDLPTDIFPR
jgi:hypothetical protein